MYTLKALCAKAYQELLDSGLKEKTVYGTNWYIWNRLVRIHGEEAYFKPEMAYEYCKEYFGRDIFSLNRRQLIPIENRYKIAFNNFIQSSLDIPFKKQNFHFHKNFILSDKCEKMLEEYLTNCKANGNSERTILNKSKRIKNFFIDSDFENLTVDKLKEYLKKRISSTARISCTIEIRLIKSFIFYAYQKGYIEKDIFLAFPNQMKSISGKSIPSTYTSDEIRILLDKSYDYSREDNHYRNYALLCLITYSGIRVSDVINLKLSNIDWHNNVITIIQQKTKRKLVIPLIPEIGNPIVNYITKERVPGETLFTTENGNKLMPQYISTIINVYFQNSGIEIGTRHYGAHALRHSLATNLINKSIDAFTVANTLGHSNINCVHIYAKLDLNNLRKCVLEAPYEKID